VKWLGYPDSENIWGEKEGYTTNPDTVAAFEADLLLGLGI
jgi:hypothetical protein